MPNEAELRRAPLADGDVVVLYDRRRRRYRVQLAAGALFETHLGYIPHDELRGRTEGFTALTNKGHRMLVLRPTFAEGVLSLGLFDFSRLEAAHDVPQPVRELAEERWTARQAKDYPESDRLRDEIAAAGYVVRDREDGYDLEKEQG